jgi:hypothetical protein
MAEQKTHEFVQQNIDVDLIKTDPTNPNKMSQEKFEALVNTLKVKNLQPIIVDKNYNLVDGEHRLKAYKLLGKKEIPAYVDITIADEVELKLVRQQMNMLRGEHDKKKQEKEIQFLYEAGRLNDLSERIAAPIEEFRIALEKTYDTEDLQFDWNPMEHHEDTFLHGNIKQIMIYFDNKQFEEVIPRIKKIMEEEKLKNHTELFMKMLENYESN